jgi:hypothetical protein
MERKQRNPKDKGEASNKFEELNKVCHGVFSE